jgi:hypothetical protein
MKHKISPDKTKLTIFADESERAELRETETQATARPEKTSLEKFAVAIEYAGQPSRGYLESLLTEHAGLIAVAEAGEEIRGLIEKLMPLAPTHEYPALARFDQALANLAAAKYRWTVTVCKHRFKIEEMGQAVCWIDLDKPNAERNAAMISAAPDLLAALEKWNSTPDNQCRHETSNPHCLSCETKAAIKKSKGTP